MKDKRLPCWLRKDRGRQGYGHRLGGGHVDLGILAVVDRLPELVARTVDDGCGVVHRVLPIQKTPQRS